MNGEDGDGEFICSKKLWFYMYSFCVLITKKFTVMMLLSVIFFIHVGTQFLPHLFKSEHEDLFSKKDFYGN